MRNKNDRIGKCETRMFTKHHGVCRTYSVLQTKYAEILEADSTVKTFEVNVPIRGTTYTTDFLITQNDGTIMANEALTYNLHSKYAQRKDWSFPFWCCACDFDEFPALSAIIPH